MKTQKSFSELSAIRQLAIEQAAAGCVSGHLSEWPVLSKALEELGHGIPPDTDASRLRELCRSIMSAPS